MITILVNYAVKEEFIPLQSENCKITYLHTGIGKTKSASLLTKNLCQNKPDLVLNIGTAGTLKHHVGDVFVATRFIDRDFEAIKLPGVEYEIQGLKLLEPIPALKNWVLEYGKQGTCSTGDTFVTEAIAYGDVIDMEAYAQAYVCREFSIPFLSVKYITDIVGKNSVQQWEDKLSYARTTLANWFDKYQILSLLESK